MDSSTKPRSTAVTVLRAILRDKRTLDEAMNASTWLELSARDRAFCHNIVYTTLRRHGQLSDVLARFLQKPLPVRSGCAFEILLAAAAQILFLKTPAYAAINTAVQQCRNGRREKHFAKLANAVLRRIAEHGNDIIARQDAARLNTPAWLWQRWSRNYGEAVTREIARTHMLEPALDISVKSDPVWWAEQLGGTLLAGGSIRLNNHKGRIEDLDGFNAGHWWVQDVAASLPVKLLGGIDGKKIADLCAAPGGKTAQLLCAGAEVCAVDASAPRVQRMKENLQRLGLQTEIVTKDIMQWSPAKTFDVVLLDAPCSATGTIRRHPDLAHIKDSSDIVEMAAKQARLLDKAVNLLGWGGILLYCTCSLEPEEAEGQIENFIKHTPSVNLLPFTDASSATATDINRDWITPEGYLRTMPCHEMDGFFAARMEVTNGL